MASSRFRPDDLAASDIDAWLVQDRHKRLLRFITCGSVDDGKSTLIGRLLYDSRAVLDDQMTALEADSRSVGTQGEGLDFALLVDGLAAAEVSASSAIGIGCAIGELETVGEVLQTSTAALTGSVSAVAEVSAGAEEVDAGSDDAVAADGEADLLADDRLEVAVEGEDELGDLTLLLRREAGDATRTDLALLGHQRAEGIHVEMVDLRDLLLGELGRAPRATLGRTPAPRRLAGRSSHRPRIMA